MCNGHQIGNQTMLSSNFLTVMYDIAFPELSNSGIN